MPNTVYVRGLILHCVPKNAQSAMKTAVLAGLGIPPPRKFRLHRHPALNLHEGAAELEGYRWGVVRDPLERLVSLYKDKIRRDNGIPTRKLMAVPGRSIGMSLEAFAETLLEHRDQDIHTRTQSFFLHPEMDHLGRFENLENEWRDLRARFDWLPDLGRINSSPAGPPVEVSDRVRQIVRELYAEDYAIR